MNLVEQLSKDDKVIKLLEENRAILEEIRAILTLSNHEKLEDMKKELLPKDSVKKKIYDLCDGTKTTTEMAQAIGKDNSYVNSYLSILRKEGSIKPVEKEGRQVHEQIF